MNENQLIDKLMATGLFEFAEPDWLLFPVVCPNDSRFNSQWHHGASKMNSCAAWDLHTGTPAVTVGICDTGVQTNHPDLLLNRKEGYNAVNKLWESQGGQIGPVASHGTETTGCAAANGNNGTGVSGVGWNLSHRMLRVSNSSGGSANLSTLVHAALTSIQAGDKVANVSYSGVNSASVRSTATQIKALGGLLTWAAGNDGANLNWGSRDADDVIVVGATTGTDNKASFSAYGPSVDLMAPGNNVYTTTTSSGYASVSGTSFAAPLTAGLIGLVWSANPALTPDEVEAIIKAGCDDLGSAGVDNTFGYGRINSYKLARPRRREHRHRAPIP
ncbi:MAG: S8 family serine peptidase [Phycisphaerales bacterium]|nr:S8 family serine peptidase [Phycisphaerales bacterium]